MMIRTTVNEIVYGDWDKIEHIEEPVCVYVVKDEDAVLYVGRSVDPFNRLLEHFGEGVRGSNARIGSFYKEFKHESGSWVIEMHSMEECEKITQKKCDSIERSEVMMILHLKPCLNKTNNIDPSPLPEKYTGGPRYPEDGKYALGHLVDGKFKLYNAKEMKELYG
jgi:predicted GIY-YIG superfamily endonuclease